MTIETFNFEHVKPLLPHFSTLFTNNSSSTLSLTRSAGSFDCLMICELFKQRNTSICVLTGDNKHAEILNREISSFIDSENVAYFPSRDAVPYNMKSPFGPIIEQRFRVMNGLMQSEKKVIITPIASLLQKIVQPKEFFNKTIRLHINDEIDLDSLSSWLIEIGFSRESIVQDIGTFAIRGDIVDIFPFLTNNPIRIEFFGNTIESIREFDIFKQISRTRISEVSIVPMKEFCITDSQIDKALLTIEHWCNENKTDQNGFHKLKHKWKSQADHDGIEWFIHWFALSHTTILDYLPNDCILVWDDMLPIERRIDESFQNYVSHQDRVAQAFKNLVSNPCHLLIPRDEILSHLELFSLIYINTPIQNTTSNAIDLGLTEQPSFHTEFNLLLKDLLAKESNGYAVYIICENLGHGQRISELLTQECPFVSINLGYLEHGFIDPIHKIAVYSETNIFHRHREIAVHKKYKKALPISGFDSLNPGDFVVHIDHGIAKFCGVEKICTSGIQQDCMVLLYQDNTKVYVPIDDFYKVQKYIGKDTAPPTLSKLGTNKWEKQKEKTRQTVREMAKNLIALYAKREYLEGIQFSADTVWQKEFENSFIYDPTLDQLSAIQEIKKDMESPKPMDRLVCGDVGFGKTEVSMRAAFKAVMDGYQVAVLAPTTILTAQHFVTFTERMANFPIVIASLSRFQSTKEQSETIEKLKNGTINIVIGTHRLLSEDVQFQNLGLLIIDEEQRFGVKHKEKLKELRYKIDVLSMTATPIPRTLHMSLAGIRDLSIINTPPRNRLPIQTHVHEYHEEIIKNAIDNELDRGGQVYIVHNRISNLPLLQETIETLTPRARTITAHGQMPEHELELIMREFVAGNYDILISTTIIENGLDIPNVNTIIVNRAEMLGLSQLYQLRGRVGRSSEQAYAYFLTGSFKTINEDGLKRLRALEQYTDLGSGFQIAMRDLEIRGAGNILGMDQHGTIALVGFELYTQLLKEELDLISGKQPEKVYKEIKIDIQINAFLPGEYIHDSSTRISLYQECSACTTLKECKEIEQSIIDRFGPMPEPAKNLIILLSIKILGQHLELSHIGITKENYLQLSFHGDDDHVNEKLKSIIVKSNRDFEIIYGTPMIVKTKLITASAQQKALYIDSLLTHITEIVKIEQG